MSGRRILDAIQFLNVARSVATKHLAVRQRQLDVFTKTSTLTRAAKAQVDGVILTARAAAALAKRFNEPAPEYLTPKDGDSTATHPPSPSWDAAQDAVGATDTSFSAERPGNSDQQPGTSIMREAGNLEPRTELQSPSPAAESIANESANELNAKPQLGTSYESPQELAPEYNSQHWPRPQQLASDSVSGQDTSVDTFQSHLKPNRTSSESTANSDKDELSEELAKDLFRSPRVAQMLTNNEANSAMRYNDGRINPYIRHLQGHNKWQSLPTEVDRHLEEEDTSNVGLNVAGNLAAVPEGSSEASEDMKEAEAYKMVESRIPSSRIGRLWEYSGLVTSMAFGAIGETVRRASGNEGSTSGPIMLSAGNMERLVTKLSKMRGAALKLGQMLSFQDSKMLPESIQVVLQRVQDRADYMPASQRDKVLTENLGPNWRDLFASFDEMPMAAASIGQVHGALLRTGQPVAVKVQYPGVADSIDSDLSNLSILLTASRLLPRGLYLDRTIANARVELAWECNYKREAECGRRFKQLLRDDPAFVVPDIISHASGKQVLTMERLNGIAVTKIQSFTQAQRDWIGTQILRLCLREIIEFRYMQTDPNWTNFLYNIKTGKLELLDFGASREFEAGFITDYVHTLSAASRNDRETCHDLSIKLGYLTGHESPAMVDAHINSILTLAEPFMDFSPDIYDFSNQTITNRVRELIPLMLRERLAPPPEETYSLHRKLSGAFLLCARLGSRVRCKELFVSAIAKMDDRANGRLTR